MCPPGGSLLLHILAREPPRTFSHILNSDEAKTTAMRCLPLFSSFQPEPKRAFSGYFRGGGELVARHAHVDFRCGTSQIAFTVRLRRNHLCNEMPEYAADLSASETP
ncbi:uncharacterized protein LOC115238973 isoform X2 [Formica exsecta]|uniref:uncharacterized protein LOC115238973 isoform X2 n=1 Tax=Formica exsecta TaxID=72781 RepID=UPI001141A86B|nr:uncharacterized protein LOC115238973 isoform X2 [Formica exsecta]